MSFVKELQLKAKVSLKRVFNFSAQYNKYIDDKHIFISVFIVALLLLLGSLLATHFLYPYTSDATAIQTIFYQHMHLPGNGRAWLTEDTYIIKVPIYLLEDLLFANSRAVLFVTTLAFNVVGFGLFFYSFKYFVKRFRFNAAQAGLVFIWFFSSITLIVRGLINLNVRNLEIGISFLVLMLFARYQDGELQITNKIQKCLLIITGIVLLGLFFYNDPLFVYMFGVPLIIFFVWRFYFQKFDGKLLYSLLFIVIALGLEYLWHALFQHFGIYSRHPQTQLITFQQLGTTIPETIQSYFSIFSASFWGKDIVSIGTLRNLLNALVMLAFVVAPLMLIFGKKLRRPIDPWLFFWTLQPLYITLVFIISTNTTLNGPGAYHFLVLAPFYAPISLAFVLNRISNKRTKLLANIILGTAILLNIAFIGKQLLSLPKVSPNAQNYAVINAIENAGLQKGFGSYWDSNINTYLSNNKVVVIPANCLDVQHFLMDDKALSIPASRSFYIYNTLYQHCDLQVMFDKLGYPTQTIRVDNNATIYVFNSDITNRMNPGFYYQKP